MPHFFIYALALASLIQICDGSVQTLQAADSKPPQKPSIAEPSASVTRADSHSSIDLAILGIERRCAVLEAKGYPDEGYGLGDLARYFQTHILSAGLYISIPFREKHELVLEIEEHKISP